MIKICIPYYQEIDSCRAGLKQLQKDKSFVFGLLQSTLIYEARNHLINDGRSFALRQDFFEFDYYFFIDSDISFTAKDVRKILEHDLPICGGAYRTHQNPALYQAGMFDEDVPGVIASRFDAATTGLREVDFCGAGFLCIKREVFQALDYPWFYHPMVQVTKNGVLMQKQAGEDIGFCLKAKEAGFKVMLDFDCKVKHRLKKPKSVTL